MLARNICHTTCNIVLARHLSSESGANHKYSYLFEHSWLFRAKNIALHISVKFRNVT